MKMRDCPSGCGTVDMYVQVAHGIGCVAVSDDKRVNVLLRQCLANEQIAKCVKVHGICVNVQPVGLSFSFVSVSHLQKRK